MKKGNSFHEYVKNLKEDFLHNKKGLIGPIRAVELKPHRREYNFDKILGDAFKKWNKIEDYFSDSFSMINYKGMSKIVGYFAAYKDPETGKIGTGYSYASVGDSDNFSTDTGIQMAINRAIKNSKLSEDKQKYSIFSPKISQNVKYIETNKDGCFRLVIREFPIPISSQMGHFVNRCNSYFKTRIY